MFGRQTGIRLLYLESNFGLRLVLLLITRGEHSAWEKDVHAYAVELKFGAEGVGETTESVFGRSVGGITDHGHISEG